MPTSPTNATLDASLSRRQRVRLAPLASTGLAWMVCLACSTAKEPSFDPADTNASSSDVQSSSGNTSTANDTSSDESSQQSSLPSDDSSSSAKDSGDTSDSADDTDVELPKFDLGDLPDFPDNALGCQAVDFLFVIDNSGSMGDEQANLINSFPGFLKGIQDTLTTDDWHIMIVDSDATAFTSTPLCGFPDPGICLCFDDPACCATACADPANTTCDDMPCDSLPDPACDQLLGAAKTVDLMGMSCNIKDGRPFMLSDDPSIEDTFSCLASVGTMGNGQEQMMEAMLRAVGTPLIDEDQCNEAFLREDAILVVTFITDEEEKAGQGSPGDPAAWKQRLVELKGDEASIVMIGFYGDTGEPGAICMPPSDDQLEGAEVSPRLRQFVDSFGDNGLSTSVCADDFGPAFEEAVAKIDTVCDTWNPG